MVTTCARYYLILLSLVWFGMLNIHAQVNHLDKIIYLESQTESVSSILDQIEQAGNLSFGYGPHVPSKRIVQIEGGNKSIQRFLDEILIGVPVKYLETPKKILLKPGPTFQIIRGRVTDVESGSPLAGAHILIVQAGPLDGFISDSNGFFRCEKVPIGRCNLRVSYMGYRTVANHDILVGSGKEIYLDILMKEEFRDMSEVRVEYTSHKGDPKNDMAMVSARSFTVEETGRYPAAVNDPARMALVFPGVTQGDNDLFNEMVIRGNTPSSVRWRMEGIEILTPNHFSLERSTTGWINAISSNILGPSDFLTGAFPAEYGNSLGGIFDLSLRNGNNMKREYSLQLGTMGIDLSAEGPFHRNYHGSYLVNFRYAITALNSRIGSGFEEEIVPRYSDLCYKINLPTKKAGSFSLWGIGGMGWATNKNNRLIDSAYNETKSEMATLGLTHLYYPNDNSYLRSVIAYSMNNSDLNKDVLAADWIPVERLDFNLSVLRASVLYRHKFSRRIFLKTGAVVSHLMYNYEQWGPYPGRVNSSGHTNTFQAHFQGKISLLKDLYLNAGIHFFHFALNNHSSFEPRLGLKWNFAREQSFGLGIGKHNQHDFISSYFQEAQLADGTYTMPNRNLGLARANHYIFSYQNSLIKNLHIKTELYYQDHYQIPVYKFPVYTKAPVNYEYPMDTLSNFGTGRNYGIEFTFEKYFSRGYYFFISSSVFDSRVDPGNDTLYHTRYNAGFSNNVVGGKEFTIGRNKQNIVGLNAKVIWTGGNRGQYYDTGTYPPRMIFQERFEVQYRDYFRLDVNFSYRVNRPNASHIISLDIQNLTNKPNILRIDWNFAAGRWDESLQYGIFPFFNYKVEF